MTLEDSFKLLVSGYYGIYEMDEYSDDWGLVFAAPESSVDYLLT